MPGELTVQAGWALWSKPAGTRQDYSVISCSTTPFSRADFAAIITRFAVGTPDTMATGADALPWTTVSWVGVDSELHLGIAITDKTGQADGVGRPITQTAYYCVPYAQLASMVQRYKAPVSYTSLCAAAARHPLSQRDGTPVSLEVEPVPADRMADAVRRFGEPIVEATAALVLSGPVNILAAEGATPVERLEFIDAVAALLPYGYRARFSAATWSQSGTKHRVRLAFAAHARDDAAVVTWRRGAETATMRGVAHAYYEQLRRLSDGQHAGRSFALPAVIAHLAADVQPNKFEQPQAAIDSLGRLDQPFRVLRAVHDRTGVSLAELRQVFRLGRVKELPTETDAVTLLAELADQGGAEDWPDLSRDLATLRNAEDRARITTAFGRRMIWTERPDTDRALDCLRFANDHGFADGLLAELLRLPDSASGSQAGLAAAAELLEQTALAATSHGEYPHTYEFLRSSPVAVAEYLAALSRTGRAGSLLRLVDAQGVTQYGGTFSKALGIEAGEVTPAEVADLAKPGPECVRALLQVASNTRHLSATLRAFTHWLAARGEIDPQERWYWTTYLPGLDLRDPRLRPWLDTALLLADGEPTALPPAQPPDDGLYRNDLTGIWTTLSGEYALFSAERCVYALTRYLSTQPWTRTRQQAEAVTELAQLLRGFDPEDVLGTAVASGLAATPDASQWSFALGWIDWARAYEPEAIRDRVLSELAKAPPDAEPGYLAGLCATACHDRLEPDAAFRPLAASGALTSADQACQLLIELQQRLEEAGADDDTIQKWQFRLSEMLARGDFGAQLGHDVREVVSERSRWEIWRQLKLLAIFASSGSEGHGEWTDGERADLSEIADEIDAMLKKSRKFQLPKRLRNPFGGGPAEETAPEQDTMTVPNVPAS